MRVFVGSDEVQMRYHVHVHYELQFEGCVRAIHVHVLKRGHFVGLLEEVEVVEGGGEVLFSHVRLWFGAGENMCMAC